VVEGDNAPSSGSSKNGGQNRDNIKPTMTTQTGCRFAERYNEFVDRSPQRSLYCHTWWLDATAPGRYEILTVEKDNAIQAAWPVVWSRAGSRKRIVMPPLSQKLGILFAPGEAKYAERLSREHRLTEDLLAQLPPGTLVSQQFHESFASWLPFYWNGFEQTTRCTYLLEDLTDLEAVWAGMRNTMRTEIRKGQNRGYRVRETDDLEHFHTLAAKTFTRKGMKISHDLELVRRIDAACLKHAGRRMFVAEGPDGRAHACSYLVYDAHSAVYLLGGLDEEAAGSGAKALTDWHMIQFAGTVSKQFDFEGSMLRTVEPYFRQFGARQVPYSRIWGRAGAQETWSLAIRLRHLAGRVLRKMTRIIDG
jgi:hypothetical protein